MPGHTDIQTLYLTVYNRPADWEGLLYWAGKLEAEGLGPVSQAFTQAPEFDELYAGQTPRQQVDTLYQHLLGRDAEPEGRHYWSARLEEGVSLAEVARLIAGAARGEDAVAFEARIDNAQDQTYGEIIDTLYAGYYGRAADAEGKAFWLAAMKSSDGELEPIIEAFGNSDEYVEQYGGLETEAQLNALYNKLFSRDPDPEGAAYWAEQLDSGVLTLSSLAFTLAQAAAANDKEALENNIQAVKNLESGPESESGPEPESEPEVDPSALRLELPLNDQWSSGSNSISFELEYPSVITLDEVSLQGGGALSLSASSSISGGVTTASYSMSATNGANNGVLELVFVIDDGSAKKDVSVEMQALTVNDEILGDTRYVVEEGVLVEPEYASDAKGILDDYGDTPATASVIGLGETVEGMIDKVTDKDVFAVDLQAGQSYLFQMTPEDDLDTAYLRLLNPDGDSISEAADASDDEAQFDFTADSTDTYYLEASEQGDDDRGNYIVVVEEIGVTTGDDGIIA